MDMTLRVRECAHRLVDALAASDRVNIMAVTQLLAERNMIVYQAIGWLACEGKITYVEEGNQTYVSVALGRQ
jgi:hypothetical protein